ncbi:hypothetical protein MPSEU_001053600 [Mayamaea pseudoterrestris]|nr:hypothetical protein MPSEU_001053600 [Mayamaea pseudoterrestris]
MSDKTQVYMRVKHRQQTYCLLCDLQDSVASVKQSVCSAMRQHSATPPDDPLSLRLLNEQQQVLKDDEATLESLALDDNALWYVLLPVAENEWEAAQDVVAAATTGSHHEVTSTIADATMEDDA